MVKAGVFPADRTLAANTLAHIVLASPALPLTTEELGESSEVGGRSCSSPIRDFLPIVSPPAVAATAMYQTARCLSFLLFTTRIFQD